MSSTSSITSSTFIRALSCRPCTSSILSFRVFITQLFYNKYFLDSLKKINSEYPQYQKRSKKYNLIKSIIESSLPETVKEEKKEEEEELTWQRQSRFSIMRDMNEFGKFGGIKRHNSLDGIKKNKFVSVTSKYSVI